MQVYGVICRSYQFACHTFTTSNKHWQLLSDVFLSLSMISLDQVFVHNLCLGFLCNLLLQKSSKVRLIICYICKDKKKNGLEHTALVLQALANKLVLYLTTM